MENQKKHTKKSLLPGAIGRYYDQWTQLRSPLRYSGAKCVLPEKIATDAGLHYAHAKTSWLSLRNRNYTSIPMIGLEIELEFPDRASPLTKCREIFDSRLKGRYVAVSDGSLSNGAEFVTEPIPFSEIPLNYSNFHAVLTALSKYGCRSHDAETCGLHMHVSRSALSDSDWKALKSFVNKNHKLFESMSRRKNYRYCKFGRAHHSDRYQAVNFQPDNTREFRFWRGTLNPASFFASIEITMLLVEYFRKTPKRRGLGGFIKFVDNSNKVFAKKYLHEHYDPMAEILTATRREIAQISAEERAQRRGEREFRQANRRESLRSELCRIAANLGVRHASVWSLDPDQMERKYMPVKIGGLRRELSALSDKVTPIVLVTIPKGSPESHVYARKHTGWGRSSFSWSFRSGSVQ